MPGDLSPLQFTLQKNQCTSMSSRPIRLACITTVPITQHCFLDGQTQFLKSRGIEIHSIASPGEHLDLVAERDGVPVYPVQISRSVTPLSDLVSIVNLVRTLRTIQPDIVNVSTPKAALLGAIAARIARVPHTVFLVRGLVTEYAKGPSRWLYRNAERLSATLSDTVVCVSPSLLDFARRESIVSDHKGQVVASGMSNGINASKFRRAVDVGRQDSPVVGYVGRLAADKGIEDLARAWPEIKSAHPNARLMLVGPWESEDSVSPQVREAIENDPSVTCSGFVDDVTPYYEQMAVFVYPTHGSEGFPNAPMEAAASGLPVVATETVGCVDAVVEGRTGKLIPPRSPDRLAEAVISYLDAPDVRVEHGEAGRQRVEDEFRQELIWQGMVDIYQEIGTS